jgi:hypothetical protein
MNAVEIEEAVSRLAEAPFDPEAFPLAFLEAFGNKATTLKRLSSNSSSSNQSDLPGGVLQRNNIHLKVCAAGEVTATLTALRDSPATARYKAKFILATDGISFEAENTIDGETIACNYPDFHDHFGFFLALAGITTVKQIRENAFDIKATGRLNRLYIELLKDNPDWDKAERREELNHFMARLIFCFFAEDTNIFHSDGLFTATVTQMSASDSANTHEVISELFRSMSTPPKERGAIRNWADRFPYVNGGLFSGGVEVPRFSKIARSYLLHVGNLDWKKINPDIFGSMIQAVADDEERGALGMHYTSVPNILKVLNPLFLDDLRGQLEVAGENARKLLNLRQRLARIRVFDPACGSGNFLVIAYKEMRVIEAEINRRRGEPNRRSEIPRLALVIAEYQCNVLYFGQQEARLLFLPLERDNWITCGNALRLDWLSLCPPTGTGVKVQREDLDLFSTPNQEAEIDFENEGGETYVCGNPPYKGTSDQTIEQKADMSFVFDGATKTWKSLDYVCCWFYKFALYAQRTLASCAFVATNSICQGEQVARLWPLIFSRTPEITFAHTSFKWANLASHNAGVTVVIIGLSNNWTGHRIIFEDSDESVPSRRIVSNINAYLVPQPNILVEPSLRPMTLVSEMINGNKPVDGGFLMLSHSESQQLINIEPKSKHFIKRFLGSSEFIKGNQRFCLWITGDRKELALSIPAIKERVDRVAEFRSKSRKGLTQRGANTPHEFQQVRQAGKENLIVIPAISSEQRDYLPCGVLPLGTIISNKCYALFDAPLWNMALIASRLHWVWIGTVCVRLEMRFSYSNTLGWNTFPVPTLTDQNKTDLTRCAEDILLARESHFPDTIADLYGPDKMPKDLREAHDRNDEVLDRIYIGRRFKNDTERLEKLFDLYTKMTSQSKC